MGVWDLSGKQKNMNNSQRRNVLTNFFYRKQKLHYMPRLFLGNYITRLTFIDSTCKLII